MKVGKSLFGLLLLIASFAFAELPPPDYPYTEMSWQATLASPPSHGLRMGKFYVKLEQTTLADVIRETKAGRIAHRGDGADSEDWLCYTNLNVTPSERIWFGSGEEMDGPNQQIGSISAQIVPGATATFDCPALPKKLLPIKTDHEIWLGTNKVVLSVKLGVPSHVDGAWQSYDYQGKTPGACDGGGFDVLNGMLLKFENETIRMLFLSQTTSC